MALSLVQRIGPNSSTTAGQSIATQLGGATKPQVGDLVILHGSRDNVASDTGATDTVTDDAGNTYTKYVQAYQAASANAGLVVVQFYSVLTVAWPGGTNTITWNHTSTNITARAVSVGHYTKAGGSTISAVAGNPFTGTATGTLPTATATNVGSGDLVVATVGSEANSAPTGDSDTTNGSWTTIVATNTASGGSTANQAVGTQHKITTGAGNQAFNPTCASTDNAVIVATYRETAGGGSTTAPPPRRYAPSAALLGR